MSYPEARYLKETGEHSGVLRTADAPPDLSMARGGTQVRYLATGGLTNGAFGLYRWEMGPKPSGPGAHFHRTMTESFYVLSGTIRLFNGEKWADGRPGDFLYVPEGGVHAFRNESGEPATMLILFTPGAPREAYFEELADIAQTGRELTAEEWTELYLRHDQYMV
ncbi:cupin domain-containing protein [Nonomuraea phyllanthi]|uniref:Cupin domain-containing protein n=1 Tax=Nonomuraea phyllanthi TaxID=2219224 RepID=A0A5C4W245_9ACTN|nr:cupin domain-containing protein [Nonomuraea phyllanthi]KAB8190908.1 cupin domain-containing protein [Nonomuraea phyllanthi]QFY11902.1 cupin domain-containing protein [Nonomuraea phyllanthi]